MKCNDVIVVEKNFIFSLGIFTEMSRQTVWHLIVCASRRYFLYVQHVFLQTTASTIYPRMSWQYSFVRNTSVFRPIIRVLYFWKSEAVVFSSCCGLLSAFAVCCCRWRESSAVAFFVEQALCSSTEQVVEKFFSLDTKIVDFVPRKLPFKWYIYIYILYAWSCRTFIEKINNNKQISMEIVVELRNYTECTIWIDLFTHRIW